ncbi:MAG: hypothetical protein WC866_03490 [Patescibacteria group bacterium]|jgi:hypothetical protein
MKNIFLFGIIFLLMGAGCATTPAQPEFVEDATPGVNEENCVKSGGVVEDNACACPENYVQDPAGFCLDVQGKPGGEMRP